MSWLAIDGSGPRAGLAVVGDDGAALWEAFAPLKPGLIETFPALLAQAAALPLTAVAVIIGPGSFTGLRTTIALAQGFAAAAGLPLHGVTAAEAYAQAELASASRPLWVALHARRGRLFLVRDGAAEAFDDTALPIPKTPVSLAGDAANDAAARLAAAGADIRLTDHKRLNPVWAARAALARAAAGLPPHAAEPLYIDPPEAKRPAAGLRPLPA